MAGDDWCVINEKIFTVKPQADRMYCSLTVPPLQWCQVRIGAVIPTIDLLGSKLKQQILDIYSKRVTYCPPFTIEPTKDCTLLDDHPYTSKIISSVVVFGSDTIEGITFNYLDGTQSNCHGNQGEREGGVFMLRNRRALSIMLAIVDLKAGYHR